MLKHLLTSDTRCLEYYKDRNWRKQAAKGVLTLHAGYEITRIQDNKKKHAFDVKSVDHTFRVAASSTEEEDEWIKTLETQNVGKFESLSCGSFDPSQPLFECPFCSYMVTQFIDLT